MNKCKLEEEKKRSVVNNINKKNKNVDYMFILTYFIILIKDIFMVSIIHSDNINIFNKDIIIQFMDPRKMRIFTHSLVIIIILSFAFLFKKKGRLKYYITVDIIFSLLMIVDLVTARSIGGFITLNYLKHGNLSFKDIFNFYKYLRPIDIIFLMDIPFIIKRYKRDALLYKEKRKIPVFILVFLVAIFSANYLHKMLDVKGKVDDVGFITHYWEPFGSIYDTSPLGYIAFDFYDDLKGNKRSELTSEKTEDIEKWFDANKEDIPENDYKGIFKGKNVILIQTESVENFMINQSIGGEEITPYLNKMIKNSLYFPNFYDQTNSGVSSDADLMTNTGLFPIRGKSTFWENPYTEYESLPKILKDYNYNSLLLHGEKGGNWNFKIATENIGFDKVLDRRAIDIKPEEVNYFGGISDKTILMSFLDNITEMEKPFYGHGVILNSHFGFDYVPREEWRLNLPSDLNGSMVEKYLQSVNYVDKEIEYFINELKEKDLTKDTIVIITGDHGGINKYCMEDVSMFKDSYPWMAGEHPKVPFIIYSEGFEGETVDTIGGQIDILPTLSYLLGVDKDKYVNSSVGKVLVNTNKNYALLNDNSIIGDVKEEEKEHILDGFWVSHNIIKGNYFKLKSNK
ncbi:LTA synthase family protein [Clostridium algidicarnis]|uniref:LTA synthase family protein n=1 Tax=Clostridium algidicarnis TaxID=37659 RepID=UPI001C0DBA55|nr:LTA synthase family protein [Clostridium algidicarnis]MBU3204465.1 LTA synthase family protein [Clostridium algidicarnis]MBU3212452.1 LTA synthase family protein [Clostridium algidicarnis]MBU3222883.1 LTA synthase family protein [Clostridium algidicarnis]MCB2286967.1 LTA synthase family protein [Clostridium algidicarnis]